MSTDVTTYQGGAELATQMDFARMVTAGGGQSILPDAYRGNPANVLIAVGLGQAMGLSPAESLYRISVIKGKPSASAELIAANVRRAGHKLRVRGDENSATATIIRADDPDYEFTVTRDLEWARRMGLASNDNYKKQPGTMLQWRAISAVARLACPEALYGVTYTPDEVAETQPEPAPKPRGMDALRQAVNVDTGEVSNYEAQRPGDVDGGDPMSDRTRARMFALFAERGITDRDEQVRGIAYVIGRQIESRGELTEDEARAVIARLQRAETVTGEGEQA